MYLCKTFEQLAQRREPKAFFHCVTLGIPPLEIVFGWIFGAFVGYLQVEEVLTLWDRVIAYDTLLPIPVLAAAIFCFKADAILEAKNTHEIGV